MSGAKREPGDGGTVGIGCSRRDFLTTAGLGAVGLAAGRGAVAQQGGAASLRVPAGGMAPVELAINGRAHRLMVEPRWSLLHVLREELAMTGTKLGCDRGECGACSVLIDGAPRYACLTLALEAEGAAITTVEGLMEGEELGAVQSAFVECDAYQCGYCTPGQIVAVEGLLRANPHPSLEEVRVAVSGNLCRCGAYVNIFRAAQRAAELRAAPAATAAKGGRP